MAVAITLAPLWVPLVLALWFSDLLRPAVRRLSHTLRGRHRAAAVVVALIVVCVLAPLAGATAALISGTRDLLGQMRSALEGQGSLTSVLLGGSGMSANPTMKEWADLASRYGANAWRALSMVAQASASAAIGVLVFVAAFYTFAATGDRSYRWMLRYSPIPHDVFTRLTRAFQETGRGLIVGSGGTALIQGAVATVAYAVIGIPRALVLGPLTAFCALVPIVGTGLVWIPLTIELAVAGSYWRAVIVVAVGAGLHSLIDNFVRPVLTRYGKLNLPTFVVFVSMIGGVAVFGASGALLGPLLTRLCVEALEIGRDSARPRSRDDAPGFWKGERTGPAFPAGEHVTRDASRIARTPEDREPAPAHEPFPGRA